MPLFIGYPEFVRGYGVDSFSAGRMHDERILPDLRSTGRQPHAGRQHRVPVPAAAAVRRQRSDVWAAARRSRVLPRRRRDLEQRTETVVLQRRTREPVTSGGMSLRANLLGFAVAQIDYARPFDRPGRGWMWGFSLTPGVLKLTAR